LTDNSVKLDMQEVAIIITCYLGNINALWAIFLDVG